MYNFLFVDSLLINFHQLFYIFKSKLCEQFL